MSEQRFQPSQRARRLGLAVDPAFSSNGFIFLYYTRAGAGGCDATTRANRVSRFTYNPSNDTVSGPLGHAVTNF